MGDRLTLAWSDFQKFVAISFADARSSKDFADVTLVGEDYQVEAHRLVLSAGSNFFHEVFKRAKHDHPLIYLKGTYKVEIEAILSFLYNAEVNIAQENLTQFLITSKDLKIKGVLEDEVDDEPSWTTTENHPNNLDSPSLDPKDSVESEREESTDSKEDFSYKEAQARKASVRCHFQKLTVSESLCNLCERVIQTKGGNTTGMWRHMANMHKDVDVWESILEKLQNSSIWSHFSNTTDVEFTCNLCDKIISTETEPGTLWKHMAEAHQEVNIWKNPEASEDQNFTGSIDSKSWYLEKQQMRPKRICSSQLWEEKKSSNPIWSHYERLPGYLAKCGACGRFFFSNTFTFYQKIFESRYSYPG